LSFRAMYFIFPLTATTVIYTLSLHDALPILHLQQHFRFGGIVLAVVVEKHHLDVVSAELIQEQHLPDILPRQPVGRMHIHAIDRSEEHTSELQSRENLVCRLLLEKKKNNNNA